MKAQTTKPYTEREYSMFMKTLNATIAESERRILLLDKQKKISQLSFADWVLWQNGTLKIV